MEVKCLNLDIFFIMNVDSISIDIIRLLFFFITLLLIYDFIFGFLNSVGKFCIFFVERA